MSHSFSGQYMTVRAYADKMSAHPDQVTTEDIRALQQVLADHTHAGQTCALFLYKEAALALSRFLAQNPDSELYSLAANILHSFTRQGTGSPCMAAAQALGSLPLYIIPPQPGQTDLHTLPDTDLSKLVATAGLEQPEWTWAGRSLLLSDSKRPDCLLVLKLAFDQQQAASLANEAWWMQYLAANPDLLPGEHIPSPLDGPDLPLCRVRLASLPGPGLRSHAADTCVCLPYMTVQTYFSYAVDPDPGRHLSLDLFTQIVDRAARSLGRLSARGIVHKAPIPLFHNRVQGGRRDDHGQYIWTRGGRLDRWLHSCLYPNFGLSGLRDFEHLEPWSGYPRDLFHDLGTQILSLILVAGTYFRLQEPELMGCQPSGQPVDATHLFDREAFQDLLQRIARAYASGFLGWPLDGEEFDSQRVVDPLIQALGIDQHMTEIFRIQDQLQFQRTQDWQDFLLSHGLSWEKIQKLRPGQEDLTLYTGPHLGEFNSRISVPELIDFTASIAGLCMGQAYLAQNKEPAESGSTYPFT